MLPVPYSKQIESNFRKLELSSWVVLIWKFQGNTTYANSILMTDFLTESKLIQIFYFHVIDKTKFELISLTVFLMTDKDMIVVISW